MSSLFGVQNNAPLSLMRVQHRSHLKAFNNESYTSKPNKSKIQTTLISSWVFQIYFVLVYILEFEIRQVFAYFYHIWKVWVILIWPFCLKERSNVCISGFTIRSSCRFKFIGEERRIKSKWGKKKKNRKKKTKMNGLLFFLIVNLRPTTF